MRLIILLFIFCSFNICWSAQFNAIFQDHNKISWSQHPGVGFKTYLCSAKKYWMPSSVGELKSNCDVLIQLNRNGNSLVIPNKWPPKILKTALQLFAIDRDEVITTRVKILGVLDDLYFYRGTLGLDWNNNKLKLWAPTANWVKLYLYRSGTRGFPFKTLSV